MASESSLEAKPMTAGLETFAKVRALLAEGLTDREIARRVGISPTTVGSLRRVAS